MAMAAKDFVANIFGGITIFVDKPFKLGDRVIVSGYDGFVREVGIRSTRIQTLAGRIVTIPNSKFTDSFVENITMEPSRRVKVTLGLVYSSTPEQLKMAQTILGEVAENHTFTEESVLSWFEEFAAYSLNISMIYYIMKDGSVLQVQNEMNLAIFERFTQAGLQFAFPTQTVYHQQIQRALPEEGAQGSA
jgi:MscS family membrane protein